MEKSALQIARASYQPKLPKGLKGAVKAVEGAPTQSVDNQEEIKKLFPNTYGMPLVEFVPGEETKHEPMNRITPGISGLPKPKKPKRNTQANIDLSITILIPKRFRKKGIIKIHNASLI